MLTLDKLALAPLQNTQKIKRNGTISNLSKTTRFSS